MSDELFVLNCADMTTGPNGEDLTMEERTEEIGERFSKDSAAYKKSVVEALKLQADERYALIK